MSEHDDQAAVCDWLDMAHPQVVYFAIPNGAQLAGVGRQRFAQVNKLKAEGLTPGAPDMIIAEARGGFYACAVEMKSLKGKLSDNQAQFLARLEAHGWYTLVCYGVDEAIRSIGNYLSWEVTR